MKTMDSIIDALGREGCAAIARPNGSRLWPAVLPECAEWIAQMEAPFDRLVIEVSLRELADALFGWIPSPPELMRESWLWS